MDQSTLKVTTKIIFKEFWKSIIPYKQIFFVCIAAYVIIQLIGIITPLFYKRFFDLLGIASTTAPDLIHIILIVAVLHSINWVFYTIAYITLTATEAKIMAKLKQNAFNYLMLHSHQFFANNFSGSLVQRINRFSRAFEILMDSLVFNIIPLFIVIIGSIIVTAFVAPIISVIITIWTLIIIIFNVFFSNWKIKYDIATAAADSKTTGLLSDNIANQSVISLYNSYRRETAGFKEVSDDQARKTLFSWRLSNYVNTVQQLLLYIIEFVTFYYAILLWQNGQAAIGTFVLIQTYIIGIAQQLWGVNRTFRGIYQSLADSKEMVEILTLPHEIRDIPNASILQNVKGKIEFKNVSFSFNETRNVLNDISVIIKPGEKVALVGPSGTGKTTFIRLILRLYETAAGQILIDGQNIQKITQESLRQNISLVPQDPVLFHRTIMENIRYGRPNADDREVVAAAKLAHCDDFIDQLPGKYETYVGERGVKLSGGERQRVAIARAILKHAPILILDEATSSLDSHSESLIQDALDHLMKSCTTIAIAHRLSTIKKMDRILVIKEGSIIQEGTHPQLIRKSGLYKQLWHLQSRGFIK